MSTRIQRFARGQSINGIRPQLNQIIDSINADGMPRGSVGALPGFFAQSVIVVQIRGLDLPVAGQMECVLPGQELNPSAEVYIVDPPWTFTELARAGVSYVYSDINTRVADATENQELTPLYILNDMLMIGEFEQGEIWRDMNIDGRQWAKVP